MKKYLKSLYYLRLFLFIIQFYFVFMISSCILQIGILGYVFFVVYFIYILKVIVELLSKKTIYKYDLVYNFMQCGLFIYLGILMFKILVNKIVVIDNTISYFRVNFIIIILLLISNLIYSSSLINKKSKIRR